MSRVIAVFMITTVMLIAVSVAEAQQPKKVPRIGYLSPTDLATDTRFTGIRSALLKRGYKEGENIAIEYRYAQGNEDRYPELAAELVRLKVDIIVTGGADLTIRAAKNATKTIPIVMVGLGIDPVKAGLVESLAHPGGNVTGLAALGAELGGKRLELLKRSRSKIARVAVLYDPTAAGSVLQIKEDLPVAARALRLTVQSWEVRDEDGFKKVFAALDNERPDGLYVPGARNC